RLLEAARHRRQPLFEVGQHQPCDEVVEAVRAAAQMRRYQFAVEDLGRGIDLGHWRQRLSGGRMALCRWGLSWSKPALPDRCGGWAPSCWISSILLSASPVTAPSLSATRSAPLASAPFVPSPRRTALCLACRSRS